MRRTALIIVAILIGSAFNVPSASATVVGEAGDVVGSIVDSVDPAETVPSLPPAPSAPAPAKPSPTPPPVKSPAEAPPSPDPPASGGDAPSPDRVVGAVRDSADSIASAGRETTQRAIAPTGNYGGRVTEGGRDGGRVTDGGRASASASGRDGDVNTEASRPAGAGSNPQPSIAAAEVAAFRRWLARIWPAIALGGGAGDGWGAGLIADLFLLRPAAAFAVRLLTPPNAGAAGGPGPVGHPAAANAPQPALPAVPASPDGEKTVYLAVFVALLAFLVFTIWREFRTTLRPGVR